MKIDLEKHGSVTVLVPRDALTAATLEAAERALQDELRSGSRRLVLDMTHVAFVDSAGIELLLKSAGDSASAVRPRVAGLTQAVREALYLTDTLKRFFVFESVEAAVRSYL